MRQPTQRRGVSVVVVTSNSAAQVPGLIAGLDVGLAGAGEWELVVADRDSSDGTVELLTGLVPTALVIPMARTAGYAAAINAAAAQTRSEHDLLVLTPAVRMRPSCVTHLQDALQGEGTGIAVPRLVDEHDQTQPSRRHDPSVGRTWAESVLGGRLASRLGVAQTLPVGSSYVRPGTVDWASGAVLAVSADCRRTVGSWDERYFHYSEVLEYFQRARDAGFTAAYVPQAMAYHDQDRYPTNPGLWRMLMANRLLDFRSRHGSARTAAFQAGLVLGELVRAPLRPVHRAGLRGAMAPHAFSGRPPESVADDLGVVWFAAQDWWYHNRGHSDFQLMQRVARDRPVLVVNSLGLRVPRQGVSAAPWRRVLRKVHSTLRLLRRPDPENPNYYVLSPVFIPAYGQGRATRLSAAMVRQQVRLAGYTIGLGSHPAVGVTIPTAWPVVSRLPHSTLVFNRSDLHSRFPEANGEVIRSLEDELLEHSDVVLYVSHELMRLDATKVGNRAYFLDHGVDIDHFTRGAAQLPEDMAGIRRPRVGYFGGLDDFVVDMDLFRQTALELPDVNLVLIGDASCDMSALGALPNVHWLGYRPYATIPDYGRCFDVALMPWLDNEWIRFANPIKLKEYLALGLTIVTTDYPEIEEYRDRVYVAPRPEDFSRTVERALEQPFDPETLRESVLRSSWAAKTGELLDLFDGSAAQRKPAGTGRREGRWTTPRAR